MWEASVLAIAKVFAGSRAGPRLQFLPPQRKRVCEDGKPSRGVLPGKERRENALKVLKRMHNFPRSPASVRVRIAPKIR